MALGISVDVIFEKIKKIIKKIYWSFGELK